jgi:hypothetical protein
MLVEYDFSLTEPVSIAGNFDSGQTVTIELWRDGILQIITSNVCNEVNGTGKYEWFLSGIPVLLESKVQYHFCMSDLLGNVQEGDFVLKSIEGGDDGNMPRLTDKSSYIRTI